LDLLYSLQQQDWKYIVTFDEAWFYFSNQHEQIWLAEDEYPPRNARPMISSPKHNTDCVVEATWIPCGQASTQGCKWTNQ
jgi:hypothetical protein